MFFKFISDIKKWYKGIPDRKKWIDVVTATLTIPVLLTVIVSNVLTIQKKKEVGNNGSASPAPHSSQAPINIVVENPISSPSATAVPSSSPDPSPQCKEDLPEFEIISPKENATVSGDPVCVVHAAQGSGFCPASWSYRINGSSWSPYTDQPVCLFNMADGDVEFELRIKNERGDEATYFRNFTYENASMPSPSPTSTPNAE